MRRLRDDRWGLLRRGMETTIEDIVPSQTDGDMVHIRMADGEGITLSRAYLTDPYRLVDVFDSHDLIVDILPSTVVPLLRELGISTRLWFRRVTP